MTRKTVIIASSQPFLVSGLTNLIESSLPEFQVVATTENGNEAVRLTKEHNPDLLIADIPLYGISGLKVAEQVSCNVLIYTERFESRYVLAALRYGVKGYINKCSSHVADAMRACADGANWYDKKVMSVMNSRCALKPFTPNEKQLLRWVVKGYQEEQVSKILGCPTCKVRNLYDVLVRKLKCTTRGQAVFYALKYGFMDFSDF